MRNDFAANTIFERRDDLATRRVILRIRREAQQHIQRESHRIPFNLHIAFLHDVEQSHLHLSGKIGEFVQRKYPTVGTRQHTVMNREFITQHVSATCRANGINIADNVGHGHVGRCQFFHKATVTIDPDNGRVITRVVDQRFREFGNWLERIIVNFTAGDDGHVLIQQPNECAKNAGFRLTTKAQQNKVVTRQQRVHDLRHHRFFVAQHAAKERPTGFQSFDKISTNFVFDGRGALIGISRTAERSQSFG